MGLLPNYRGTPFAGAIKLDKDERVELEKLKKIISRADNPFAAYQKELMSRGLGSGSVFQEEGPGLGISSRTSNAMRDARPVSEGGKRSRNQFSSEELTKKLIQNLGRDEEERNSSVNMPSTLSGIEYALDQIKKAGGSSDASETPLTTLAKRQLQNEEFDVAESRLNSLMESGSESFADSPLDAIAAQIERARLGPLDGSGDQANAQSIIADKQRDAAADEAAEEFSADEAESFDDTSLTIAEGDKISEDTFKAAMDGFLGSARGASPDKREKTLAEYKKEFAAATGVDVSGKVDKSQALMAMGLALMQNRAGRGFNVGKLLNAVGKAGEKAMPFLEKAKTKAQTAAIAAGKYALETRDADKTIDAANREKSLNRKGYYIFERGKDTLDGNEKFKKGDLSYLNAEEINKLIANPEFSEKYSFINKSEYIDVLKDMNKPLDPIELGDQWIKDPKAFSLIGGKTDDLPPALQVLSHAQDGNYEGTYDSLRKLAESKEDVFNRFVRFQDQVNVNEKTLSELITNIKEGISLPEQIIGKVKALGKSLGLPVDTSSTAKAQQSLKNIAIDEVLRILKESGRTISEGERQRAQDRVGEVKLNLEGSNPELVLRQVEYVYNMVVTGAQKDLDSAINTFENTFNENVSPAITQAELDAINEIRKANGEKPRKMEDYS